MRIFDGKVQSDSCHPQKQDSKGGIGEGTS